jgi:hypothetical protein
MRFLINVILLDNVVEVRQWATATTLAEFAGFLQFVDARRTPGAHPH